MIEHPVVPALKNGSTDGAVIQSSLTRRCDRGRGSQRRASITGVGSRRIRGSFCALLLLALASPALLIGQFQQPTDEELKMTADPKAPGAAAVYLYREETTDDALHFHSYYERIKVLTEKGKELATIRTPYEHGELQVKGIAGRTIHADGTVVPLTAKPTDLVDIKSSAYQVNTMVFTLPSVEVGSILEYKLDILYDDSAVISPTWHIQQPYFVHKAHYMFNPAQMGGSRYITNGRGQLLNQLMYSVTAVPLSAVAYSINGRYSVDLTDIPPTPTEDWMPPLNAIDQRVEFYYTFARSGKEFWDAEGKRWAKEAERFTNPNGQVRKAVEEIVSPADTEEQKARKIYAAVMELDNTDFSRKKSEAERKAEKLKPIKNAEDVWKQKSGTGDDIVLLYVALARAAGLKVWPFQVVDRSRALFDPNYLSIGQLDDYIAVIELAGKEVFLDPGQKMCPFGSLHWKHTLASGLRLADKGAVIANTPPNIYTTAVVKRAGDIAIGPDGAVKGTVTLGMIGPDALHWRQLALENDPEEIKKRFNEYLRNEVPDGVNTDVVRFTGLDDPTRDLIATFTIEGNLGTATAKRAFLPGMFFESRASHPFVEQDKRVAPVDVHYAKMTVDDVVYRLPAGFAVESSPQTADLSWPNNAMLRIATTVKEGSVEVKRILAHNYTLLGPKDYSDLHGFYLKVAAADQQQVVLTRAAETKGK
jgi:hypothetical protein